MQRATFCRFKLPYQSAYPSPVAPNPVNKYAIAFHLRPNYVYVFTNRFI